MKIETVLIPVKLLIIKACFRFLTFDNVQDKYASCGLLDAQGAERMAQSVQDDSPESSEESNAMLYALCAWPFNPFT